MSITNKITLTELAPSDSSGDFSDITVVPDLTPPDNTGGWRLQYSIPGDRKMYHFWIKGGIETGGGIETYWAGKDDVVGDVGNGDLLVLATEVGVPTTKKVVTFDHVYPVYIYGGQAIWQNAGNLTDGNSLSVEVVAEATTLQEVANLDLAIDGERIYYAGEGVGTHGFAGYPGLVPHPDNAGYWNYDGVNIIPAPGMDGKYDMFTSNKIVSRFINNIILFGDNPVYKEIITPNTWMIPSVGYHVELVLHNRSNTVWQAAFMLNLIRKTTTSVY